MSLTLVGAVCGLFGAGARWPIISGESKVIGVCCELVVDVECAGGGVSGSMSFGRAAA